MPPFYSRITRFLPIVACLAVAACGGSGASSSDDDSAGALTQDSSTAIKALGDAASVLVYAGDSSVTLAKGTPAFTSALAAINLAQRTTDASEVPVAMCPPTNGVRFMGADKKLIGALALTCGEAPSKTNRVIVSAGDVQAGIVVDGSALEKIAKGGASGGSAPSGPLAPLAAADSVDIFAEPAQRNVKKADADFASVLAAVNLSQTPFAADEVPVAMCPSKIAVRFLDAAKKPIATLGVTCGEAPSAKNRVIVTIGDEELGISVDGASLAKIAASH